MQLTVIANTVFTLEKFLTILANFVLNMFAQVDENRILYPSLRELTAVYFENYLVTCITLVSREKKLYFGSFEDNRFIENLEAKIVKKVWQELPTKFPNISLGNFGVGPDQFTGILKIDVRLSEDNAIKYVPPFIGRFKSRTTKLLNQLHMSHSRVFWENSFIEKPVENLNDLNEVLNKINCHQ